DMIRRDACSIIDSLANGLDFDIIYNAHIKAQDDGSHAILFQVERIRVESVAYGFGSAVWIRVAHQQASQIWGNIRSCKSGL
ncbi:MAG: hypothetical protein OXH06_03575, partial [Gemmatimonadetes bacterium]|nr:hypothetical protein [Gemmatimonadota bacterium]